MARLYLDHHDYVRFDPTPDGRVARAAALPRAILLLTEAAEADARATLSTARAPHAAAAALRTLAIATTVRREVQAH